MPPAQLKQAERLAKRENRTMSELMREALRRYVADTARDRQLERLKNAVEELRSQAKATPAGRLTMRQIDAEIKAARQERRLRQTLRQPAR
jgi:hypothetical protein